MSAFPRAALACLSQAGLLFALSMCLPAQARAQAAPLLSEYNHTAWGPQHGAPNDVVQFAQTGDGWLWLASPNGLYRFDGVRFERMDSVHGQRLHSTNVVGLLATPDGGLWIGHRFGGVSHVDGRRLVLHKAGDGLPAGAVFSLARGPDGAIWASTTQGLGHLAPGAARFVTVSIDPAATRLPVHKVLFTRDGRQWVATDRGMYFREPNGQRYQRAWPYLPLRAMDEAPDGTLWAADGLNRHYRVLAAPPPGNPAPRAIPGGTGMHFDRAGDMWVLKDHALERRRAPYLDLPATQAAADQLGQQNGLSGPLPQMWFQDREDNIWVGTSAGVDRLRRNRVKRLITASTLVRPGVVADSGGRILVGDSAGPLRSADASGARPVAGPMMFKSGYRAPDGTVWIGDKDARWRREPDGRWTRFPHPPALANHSTHAMLAGRDGRMWVAMQTVGLFRVEGGDSGDSKNWRPRGDLAALPRDLAMALAGDANGRVWIGYVGSRIACIEGEGKAERVRVYGEADGLKLGNLQSILVDGPRIWAGGEQGVARFEHGRWTALATPLRGVSGMARTPEGELWLHGSEGITRIGAAEIERALREPGYAPAFERFDALDGLRGSAEQLRPIPSLTQGSDGRLWFATASNVASIDPRSIARNRRAPPVQIVALHAGGRRYEGTGIELPIGSSELHIAYTALSLSMPERVRFRYRLHGADDRWHDAGTRREAFYTNLAPGAYRFQVIAANEDGVWNDTGAHVSVTIPPRFVQTRTFAALLAVLAALALYSLYRWRVNYLTRRMNDLLHARLAERARIARGLHDTLLQSVQGLIMFFDQQARRLPHGAEERGKIEQTLELADQLMSEGRDYILDLRAAAEPRELGEALRDYGSVLLQERLAVSISGRPRALAPPVRDELYAIAREALFNCARHAGAGKVDVVLDYDPDALRMLVRDDGCGTATERPGHYGLCGMRERAEGIGAAFSLVSTPGSGTAVTVVIPARQAYAGNTSPTALVRLRDRLGILDPA